MLANSSVFQTPTNIQNNAKDVRSKVRNEWGHCNFDHWTDLDFNHCFQLMETLIRSLGLPTASEKQLLGDLQDWHTGGKCIYIGVLLFSNRSQMASKFGENDKMAYSTQRVAECGTNVLNTF